MRLKMLFILFALMPSLVFGQESITLTYQGQLSDAANRPVSASHPMTFTLYKRVSGGEPVWQEVYGGVDVVDGQFSVVLGSQSPLGDELSDEASLYLGIQVGDNDEMSPRIRLGGTLKAQWARVAEHARDVRGENIHPASVSIGDRPVIDEAGRWVGDLAGLQGPAGQDGQNGIQGEPGPPGGVGPAGVQGEAGPAGSQGEPGPAGAQGPSGAVGPQGPEGPQGAQGAAGTALDLSLDTDLDGVVDWIELAMGTDASDPADVPGDANQDGIPDAMVGIQGVAGPVGPIGPTGERGPSPGYQWDGTRLRFRNPDGSWGEYVDLVGPLGPEGLQGLAGPTGNSINLRLDTDFDGFADWIEVALGSDPEDALARPMDENLNGIADSFEPNLSRAGMPGGDTLYDSYTVSNIMDLTAISQYRVIEGRLTIDGTELTRVSLPNLRSVGYLSIQNNALLTDVDLPNLTNAIGAIHIESNDRLSALVFQNLERIGEYLRIYENEALGEIRAPMLSAVDGYFYLFSNNALETLNGAFSSLTTVGTNFHLYKNSGLTTLTGGFPMLREVGGYFRIAYNHGLTTFGTSFGGLQTIGSALGIFAHDELTEINLPSLERVGGHLSIGGGDSANYMNDSLRTLSMPALTTIGGGPNGSCRINNSQGPGTCNANGNLSLQIYRNPRLPTCIRDYYGNAERVEREFGRAFLSGGRVDCACQLVDGVYTAECPE